MILVDDYGMIDGLYICVCVTTTNGAKFKGKNPFWIKKSDGRKKGAL